MGLKFLNSKGVENYLIYLVLRSKIMVWKLSQSNTKKSLVELNNSQQIHKPQNFIASY